MQSAALDSGTVDSFGAFLKYGPIGLAGLMLVLVIVAISLRRLDDKSERLLTRFMVVGAACFALSIAPNFFRSSGEYPVDFIVNPLNSDMQKRLPAPKITIGGRVLEEGITSYTVTGPVTAVVDVTRAIEYVSDVKQQLQEQHSVLKTYISTVEQTRENLDRIPSMLSLNCPGGQNGINAASNGAVLQIVGQAKGNFDALAIKAANIKSPNFDLQ